MVGGFGNIKFNHLYLIKSLFGPLKIFLKAFGSLIITQKQLKSIQKKMKDNCSSGLTVTNMTLHKPQVTQCTLGPCSSGGSYIYVLELLYIFHLLPHHSQSDIMCKFPLLKYNFLSKSNSSSSKVKRNYAYFYFLGYIGRRGEVYYTANDTVHLSNFNNLSSSINKSQSRAFGLYPSTKNTAPILNSFNILPSKLVLYNPKFTISNPDVLFRLKGSLPRQYQTMSNVKELLKSKNLEESLNKTSTLCAAGEIVPLQKFTKEDNFPVELGHYLAGLIEGEGTFAVHNKKSTAKKYSPMIIIVFKKSDLPFAKFLCELTNCGKVYQKPERGYILWQIHDLVGVFTILKLINGKMRTPKIEALDRAIKWFNSYIEKNKDSKLPSSKQVLNKIHLLDTLPLDTSLLESNSWLSGFIDADGNFSINIHKRKNKNSTRVQLYFRIEIRQNYHRNPSSIELIEHNSSYFPIMSNIANFMGVTIYSRSRELKGKVYFSYTVVSHNKLSIFKLISYIDKFPLLSSKFLDFIDFKTVYFLQQQNSLTTSYLDKASQIRKDFNSTRTTYSWNHLKNCYISKNK